MKKNVKRVMAGVLAGTMALSTGACSKKPPEMASTEANGTGGADASQGATQEIEKPNETVTLTVFSQLANYSGIQEGWFAQLMLEKFNVKLNIVPDLNGAYDTRMAEGDLGDIVIFGSASDDYLDAVEAGMLLDWDKYGLLDKYGTYIRDNMGPALQKVADISGGVKYGFGHGVATSAEDHSNFFYTWDIRWDLYKELGYPEANTLDDMIQIFRDMKALCPTDESGNPTYAASLWPDWDGNMVMYPKATVTAFWGYDELGFGFYDSNTGKYIDCLEPNGPYIQTLKFFNTLYREGLLDPNSMTQTYDNATNKLLVGGVFWSIFDYAGSSVYNNAAHQEEGKMMLSYVPKEASPICYGMEVMGSNRLWTIGSKTEYPELCMQIINWLCTPEGRLSSEYGPKDVCWYYDEQGNTHFTDFGYQCANDKETEFTGKYTGKFNDGSNQMNNITWALDAENPESNGETYNWKNWKSQQKEDVCAIHQDWRNFTNCLSVEEYMRTTKYTVTTGSAYSESKRSDELKVVWKQVAECIVTNSWKAIYATSDDEFNKIINTMTYQAKTYGHAQCVEWCDAEAAYRWKCEEAVRGNK